MSRFVVLSGGRLPEAQTTLAAAYDCYVRKIETVGGFACIYTKYLLGFSVDLDEDHWGMVAPRSSIYKKNAMCANSVGVIDSDYKDEVCFITKGSPTYKIGERCAQFILMPRLTMENGGRKEEERVGGFGSSGQ